jgi:hypothetical protein
MGANRFVAVWIRNTRPTLAGKGNLYIRKYNVDGDWESATTTITDNARAVQALATDVINLGPCQAKPAGTTSRGPGTGTAAKHRSFLAVYGEPRRGPRLSIYRIDWCGSNIATARIHTIRSAKLGALAGARRCHAVAQCSHRILVVYERRGLKGRFMTGSGAWQGAQFSIDPLKGTRRFMDITWNPVSRRFYVGYNVIGDGFKECSIRQAAIKPSGTVVYVRTVSLACDSAQGGHRSASATDDNVSRNPDGNYLWYVQAAGFNKVYLMNRLGEFVTTLDMGEGRILELPIPVSIANIQEPIAASYFVQRYWPPVTPPSAFVTLGSKGSVLSSVPIPSDPLAAEALATKVVTGWGINCSGEFGHVGCAKWAIAARDFDSPRLNYLTDAAPPLG